MLEWSGAALRPYYMLGTALGLLDTWSHFISQQFCQRLKHPYFIQEETEEKGGREKNRGEREGKGERGLLRRWVLFGLSCVTTFHLCILKVVT